MNWPIALQLYTVRSLTEKDFGGTLKSIAKIGYRAVELADTGSHTASDVKRMLDEASLKVVGAHVPLQLLENDLEAVLDFHEQLGHRTLVVPWVEPSERVMLDDWKRLAHRLNVIGQKALHRRVQLLYHNHDFEFVIYDGQTALNCLLHETDAGLVRFELDVYWAAYAWHDPVSVMERMGNRLRSLHLKDMSRADRRFAPVGQGVLDFKAILSAADHHGLAFSAVEQDDTFDLPPLAAVEMSLRALELLQGKA